MQKAHSLKRLPKSGSSRRLDRWLSENRAAINAKIRHGIEQLDRGERIPNNRLRAHLAKLKAKLE